MMIKGAKAGQQEQRQPVIAQDSAQSISFLKILYGLSEGEISGLADGAKSIFLDDTPLLDDNGNPNFKDDKGNNAVTWDFRTGTNDQDYIKGFPSVENETNINIELKGGVPYVKTVTNSQLSAVRLRLSWGALRQQNAENGDVSGVTIEYAIDLSTDGGVYQTVLNTQISDKTSAKYERSHRIDLPRGNTWNIRVRRITPNATSDLISDKMYVDAITEIIDAKLRYPNTAMLGLQYNAKTFSSVAKLAVRCKGKIISVPTNYDPIARTYNGIWDGIFKQAYSNNPAWVYYDICTQWRYGLGNRITTAMIDKWSLYALAQYCDQMVSDGKGGQEPRFSVNVYLQAQQDAFTVLQSLASIFRAMSYWQGEQIVLDADLPKDPVYTFSRANVVGGEFNYTGTRARDRHTIAKVAWDNPEQKFKTEYEFVRDEAAIAKYGIKVLDISMVGCTSQGQAQRAGLWALKSEQLETRTVTFKTGLDGFIPTVGSIINVSDEVLAGRANSGRVAAVSSDFLTVTLDRDVVVGMGDTLIVNADNGKAQRRIVSSINGRSVTVSVAFDGVSSQSVWAVDSSDLKTMQFRVLSIKQDDVTFSITALQHEPQKYDAIDYGAIVEPTSISIIKPNVIDAPKNIVITQRNRVEQGQNIATMLVSWEQVSGAVAYDVEWRKDNGNWIKVPRTGNNSIEIDGVYSGQYLARVASVSAFDLVSNFAASMLTGIVGKLGTPPSLATLKATGLLFGMQLDWLFAQGASDTAYTEIQVASAPDTNVALLGTYAYPTNTATINGLQGNLTQYYRGRIVDKLGNVSPWTDWVKGVTDANADKILDLLNGQITESQLYKDLGAKIEKIGTIETGLSTEIKDRIAAQTIESQNRQTAIDTETQNRIAAIKTVSDGINQEIINRQQGDSKTLEVINTYKSSNDNALAAVQSDVKAVTSAQSATASKLDGVYAKVTPLTADSVLWTADSGTKAATAWTLQSAYATADMALSQKIDNVSSTYVDSLASVQRETKAVSDKYSALATDVNIIKAAQGGNIALVMDNYYTKVATDQTIAQKITTFKSEVVDPALNKKADAGALQETTAKADRIDGQLQAASTKLDGVYAKVTPLTADSVLWTADSGTKAATAWTLQSSIIDGDSALSKRIDMLQATVGNAEATIQSEQQARASQDNALSQRIDTVQSSVNGNTASIQTQQQSIDGLNAQYTVKTDVNGRIAGYGLASSSTVSDFAIRADKLYVVSPNDNSQKPMFNVLSSPQVINGLTLPQGIYLKGDLIATGSISGDKITAQTEINAPTIKGGRININDNFIVESDGTLKGKSGTFEGTVLADMISGTIDVASLKKSAWMGGWQYFIRSWNNGPIYPNSYNNSMPYDAELYTNGNTQPSYGGVNFYFGSDRFAVSNIRFAMEVTVKNFIIKTQKLLVMDDFIYIYLNGNLIANFSTGGGGGQLNANVIYNLAPGFNRIEFLLGNTGGPIQLLIMGDIVDNQTVLFA